MKHYQQGKGVEKGPAHTPQELDGNKEKTLFENIRNSTKTMIRSIFWALIIVAAESVAIWCIWNYVVPGYPLSYIKTYLFVIMVRLILRTTFKMSDLK